MCVCKPVAVRVHYIKQRSAVRDIQYTYYILSCFACSSISMHTMKHRVVCACVLVWTSVYARSVRYGCNLSGFFFYCFRTSATLHSEIHTFGIDFFFNFICHVLLLQKTCVLAVHYSYLWYVSTHKRWHKNSLRRQRQILSTPHQMFQHKKKEITE